MIARDLERLRQSFEQAFAGMRDLRQLAVHGNGRPLYYATVYLTDSLMAEAHAKHGNGWARLRDQLQADARLVGGAGPGRKHDALGLEFEDAGYVDLVVAEHLAWRTEFAQKM